MAQLEALAAGGTPYAGDGLLDDIVAILSPQAKATEEDDLARPAFNRAARSSIAGYQAAQQGIIVIPRGVIDGWIHRAPGPEALGVRELGINAVPPDAT